MDKKISTAIKEGKNQFSFKGSLEDMYEDITNKKEGIYIAYDENLFEVSEILGNYFKKESAIILLDAMKIGLFHLLDLKTEGKTEYKIE